MPKQEAEIARTTIDALRRIRNAAVVAGDRGLVEAAEAELRARGASAEPIREEGPRDGN